MMWSLEHFPPASSAALQWSSLVVSTREAGSRWMDGEHSQMINSSQSTWVELPALVCFPLLLFSNAVPCHIVMGSCSRLVALLLAVLSDCFSCWDIQHGSAVGAETPAASHVIEFQTSSAGGDNEGTEITAYCDVWWRGRAGLGKLAVLFVRKLNSSHPL